MATLPISTELADRLRVCAEHQNLDLEDLLETWLELSEIAKPEEFMLRHKVIDSLNASIIITDAQAQDMPIVEVNPHFEKTTGYSEAEVVGKNCRFLQQGDRDQPALDIIRRALRQSQPCEVDVRNYRKDGTLFWNRLNINPVVDSHGTVTHFVGIQQDITQEKLLQENLKLKEEQSRILAEISTDYTIIMAVDDDKNLSLTWIAEQAFTEITGYQLSELDLTNEWARLTHPDDLQRVGELVKDVIEVAQDVSYEMRLIRKDGQIRYGLVNIRSVADENGRVRFLYHGFSDITARKEVEHALQEANELLEARVSERTEELAKAYDDLQATRDELLGILSIAPDAIIVIDEQQKITLFNEGATQIFGYDASDIIGKNLDILIPDQFLASHAKHIQAFAQEEVNSRKVGARDGVLGKRKGGSTFPAAASILKIATKQGLLFAVILRDITESKLIEEALSNESLLLTSIMDASPVGIAVVEADGKISFANPRAEEILGLTRHSITQRHYDAPDWKHTDLDGGPWPDEKQPFVRVMTTKQSVNDIRHAIQRPDGETVLLSINGMPIFSSTNEIERIVFTVDDITDKIKTHRALIATLEKERELNELKSQFISVVAHEFRTPLTIITTSTGIIRMRGQSMDEDQIRDRTFRIDAQVRRLVSLMDEVSTFNKSDLMGHRVTATLVVLKKFLEQIITETQLAYTDAPHIQFMYEGQQDEVIMDEQLLHHIFSNLLSNAAKYSKPDGLIEILVSVDSMKVNAIVRDTGIGIPERDQTHLFEVFYRATNVGGVSGTGLGLAIVLQAVEAHGGKIDFKSVEGEGTTFYVELPHTVINGIRYEF